MDSVFDLFQVGLGPSSSHTLGPMRAAGRFGKRLGARGLLTATGRVVVELYGSLASTGLGHQTDQALALGLAGENPETVVMANIPHFIADLRAGTRLRLAGEREVEFDLARDLEFHEACLPLHENGLIFKALDQEGRLLEAATYYSVGGGLVLEPEEFGGPRPGEATVPYPFASAEGLVKHCHDTGLSLSGLVAANEASWRTPQEVGALAGHIWAVMEECLERGLKTEGLLPGPLKVRRRAPGLRRFLSGASAGHGNPLLVLDWVNMFALAVGEENAAGGRVVTAPTNGACGIIPAVLAYYQKFVQPLTEECLVSFFLASGAGPTHLKKRARWLAGLPDVICNYVLLIYNSKDEQKLSRFPESV